MLFPLVPPMRRGTGRSISRERGNLVEAAGQAGVRSFVFLSSVKAMAEPGDAWLMRIFPVSRKPLMGRPKRAAEAAVLEVGRRYGMQVVNLRLAMVYGAGGRGNLERMGRLVRRGLFPPLPETANHRSLVHVDDVVARDVSGGRRCAGCRENLHCGASGGAFGARPCLMHCVLSSGLPPCRWSVPEFLLQLGARRGMRWPRCSGGACHSTVRCWRVCSVSMVFASANRAGVGLVRQGFIGVKDWLRC
jgi:hypothetical protein